MRKRYVDRNYVLETEQEARCATRAAFADRDWRFGLVIDSLLKLGYFQGTTEPTSTPVGAFQDWARYQCAQGIYTLLCSYRLWQSAHYPEAIALLRHLLEVFVQVRYFLRRPIGLNEHLKGKRTNFKDLFEDLQPGSYDRLYGRFLSGVAHGKSALPFRGEKIEIPGEPDRNAYRPLQGVKYQREWAGATYTCLAGLALGLLNAHPAAFPSSTVADDPEFADEVAENTMWLRNLLDDGKARASDTELFDALNGLITIPDGEVVRPA